MPKQVTISPEVADVLARGQWVGDILFKLPEGQLERPLYEATNKVLVALGGKWDRRERGHIFTLAARDAMEAALAAGVAVDQKRTLEQFFTPPELAARVASLAQIEPEHRVLEPSAGDGALVGAVARACSTAIITAVEIDPATYEALFKQWGLRATILCADFLALPIERQFDRVVMNPPFGRGADMAHVARALENLRPGGRLVAIMSPHWTFATDSASQAFRGLINDHSHSWEALPEGSFKTAGTGVATGILKITKGEI